jgi:hypothetical protein
MKMSAVASQGTRRDFVDLYATARRYGLRALLDLFRQKFAAARYNMVHVFKSLTYFEDAEREPELALLAPLDWGDQAILHQRDAAPALTCRHALSAAAW